MFQDYWIKFFILILLFKVKIKTTFEFDSPDAVNAFVYSVEPEFADKVAFIEATFDSKPLKQPVSSKGPSGEGSGKFV